MKTLDSNDLPGYKNLHTGAVYYQQADVGYLRIAGPDRLDFLQRQTTNDISLLTAERSVLTVLVNPSARILDVFRLVTDGEAIGAATLPGYVSGTMRFLQSRIFFMDKVSITDASPQISQFVLEGPKARHILRSNGIRRVPGLFEVVSGTIAKVPVKVIAAEGLLEVGYQLLTPVEFRESLETILLESGVVFLPSESYQVLRVEAGIPYAGAELVEEYTPLEAGLEHAISATKGCYTGQEVIARQLTYDKVTKHLVGLRLESPVEPGKRVWADGKPSGKISSSVVSPSFGPIALAYLKRPYHQPGSKVWVAKSSQQAGIPAVVTKLPFL